ncbi:hypothetical protein [Streptomyces sp. H27-D2]|uniref:hypothetical protein n=1 Tax=Streptomyces sp. H27-D2 TaxID=3046304 RepID=UPI002DBB1D7E|nr:hypothetical protein [Streptomyces sp. H27-D2]MEC4014815.1 hypothetical protein [Streptomyces sp. H27-D2]
MSRRAAVRGAAAALFLLTAAALLIMGGPLRALLDYTSGVLTLVSLTATVVWGLISTDRTVLGPRERLLAQGVHRAVAVAALGFLVLHVALKIAGGRVGASDALLPFRQGFDGPAVLLGLGTSAGFLMVFAGATGALRSTFAGRGRAGRWRALHACAYPAWCAALLHGLKSGRPPAGWVLAGYALCLAAVAGALAVRMARRRGARHTLARRPAPAATPSVPDAPNAAPAAENRLAGDSPARQQVGAASEAPGRPA